MNLDYWNSYYTNNSQQQPSNFAQFILSTQNFSSIIDFGCGNGRDSLFFANSDKKVLSSDFSQSALDSFNHPNIIKKLANFEDLEPRLFYREVNEYDVGYARFFLSAITDNGINNFLKCARYSIKKEGKLFIECRSDRGVSPDDTHSRNLINSRKLKDLLHDNLFELESFDEDSGLSPIDKEDPVLIRCIAINKNCTKYSGGCPTKLIRSCCTDKLRDLLFDVVDLFERDSIEYWIDFGTLLGAARNKDIILWDRDIDLSTWFDNYDKIEKIKEDLLKLGYEVINNKNDRGCVYYSIYNKKLWLDIYYWKKIKDNYKHISQKFCSKIATFPQNLLGNFTKLTIFNREFVAPERYKEKLVRMYGKWEIPNKKTPYWGGK